MKDDELRIFGLKIKNKVLSPSSYETRGITHESWCKEFPKEESRWCRRIVETMMKNGKRKGIYTIDLEWATETGPIKLQIFKNGNTHTNEFFEHSVDGMNDAFRFAKCLLKNDYSKLENNFPWKADLT